MSHPSVNERQKEKTAGTRGLLRAAWVEYEHDRARYLAVAMIYYALVSLVPLLLLLLATLGLLLRFSSVVAEAEQRTLSEIEARVGADLALTITRLLASLKQGSIVATAIGLGALLLAASVLFKHLRLTFRAIWKYEPPLVSGPMRIVLWQTSLERVIAFVLVLGGGALLLAALVLVAATQWLGRLLGSLPLVGPASGWLLSAVSSLTLAAVAFASMFKVLPPVPIRWRDVWLAALLCAVGWVVASEFLAFYAMFFGDNRSAYGALGTLLACMLWLNIVSQLLFFGAELCKVGASSRCRGEVVPSVGRADHEGVSAPGPAGFR